MKTEIKNVGTGYMVKIGCIEKYPIQAQYLKINWNEYLTTLKEKYNGLDISTEIYFPTLEDAERAQEWVDSLLMMELLMSDSLLEINSIEDVNNFFINLQAYSIPQQLKIFKEFSRKKAAKDFILKSPQYCNWAKNTHKYGLDPKIVEMIINNISDNEIQNYIDSL